MHTILNWLRDHPGLAVAILAQIASAMPSPTLTGVTSSWPYKWVFGIVHSPVAISRIIITMFPQYAAIFGVNAAQREVQVSDKQTFAGSGAGPLDPPFPKPTVAELEKILRDGGGSVETSPSGAVRVIPGSTEKKQ